CLLHEKASLKQRPFAPGALPPFVARMTPSDPSARRPSELRLPALYPRFPPRELVDLARSQAFSLCAVPACCRLHPGRLDALVSPTHPPPISAFARRLGLGNSNPSSRSSLRWVYAHGPHGR